MEVENTVLNDTIIGNDKKVKVKKTRKVVRKKSDEFNVEEFRIPEFHEYEQVTNKLLVPQLKQICRKYKLRLSGKKEELVERVRYYLKGSCSAVILQGCCKRLLAHKWLGHHGPALLDRSICVNDSDIMGEDITDIPLDQFFSFTEQGFTYGFDIATFFSILQQAANNRRNYRRNEIPKNPYTRDPIDSETMDEFTNLVRYSSIFSRNFSIKHKEETYDENNTNPVDTNTNFNNNIPNTGNVNIGEENPQNGNVNGNQLYAQQYEQLVLRNSQVNINMYTLVSNAQIEQNIVNVFQDIDSYGHYTDPNWLLSLNVNQIKQFIKDVKDIFDYRAGLTDEVKRQILPPQGTFGMNGVRVWLQQNDDIGVLRLKAYEFINKLTTSGITNEDKALGVFYVLSALTLSSPEAAQAMPWLYQSVI